MLFVVGLVKPDLHCRALRPLLFESRLCGAIKDSALSGRADPTQQGGLDKFRDENSHTAVCVMCVMCVPARLEGNE